MRHYFRLPSGHSHTVNTLVAEAYALIKPGTTATEDATRRSGAIAALRDLNTDLPVGDDTLITIPYVWLRRIKRIPFRIPNTSPSALRPALAALKIHDLFTLTSMTSSYVFSLLPGSTATLAEVQRLMDICRLMKVRGMSVGVAVALRDNSPSIATPQAIYEASQGTIKSVLASADPTMPSSLSALHPAYVLQRNARRHAPRQAQGRSPRFVGGLQEARLAAEITFWRAEAVHPQRQDAERESAEAVSFLYRIQQEIALGNARFARGDARHAYPYYRRIWSLLGERAQKLGIIGSSSPEVSGPSLETVIKTCGQLLALIASADSALARQRLGVPPERGTEGLQSLVLTDLDTTPKATVLSALSSQPLWALGRTHRRKALALLSDKSVAQITTTEAVFNLGLSTTNDGARLAELREHDREVLVENVGAASVGDYATQFGGQWTALESEVGLADVKEAVGSSLGSPAPFADTVASTAAEERYPSSLLTKLRTFDRFYAWRPARRPRSTLRYVPINASFSEEYRLRILPFLRDERVQDVWQFPLSDFADPSRFAFLLPALIARPLRNSLARTLNPTGQYQIVSNLQLGMSEQLANCESVTPDTALNDLVSRGAQKVVDSEVVCGVELLDYLVDQVKRGDEAYMTGDLETAIDAYESVIAAALGCPETESAATYIQQLHVQLASIVKNGAEAGRRSPARVADWVVYNEATDIVEPLFPGLFPSGGYSVDITRRYSERVPGARTVRYYFREIIVPSLGSDLSFETTTGGSDGGGDAFDTHEDSYNNDDLIELFDPLDFFHPPWGGGGGGGIDPPGGGTTEQAPQETIDVDEVESLVLHAATYLAQLNAGLNWLGLDPDVVPPWRFEYLLAQSRYFAEKCDALQQRALGLLQAAEETTRIEQQAKDAVLLAQAGVEVAKAQESLAFAQLDAATAARDAAALASQHSKDDRWWALVGGVVAGTANAASAKPAAIVLGAAGGVFSAIQGFDQMSEASSESEAQADVADKQVDVAAEQVTVAGEQLALAEMQSSQAAAYLSLLEGSELTAAKYYELMNIVGSFAASYLRMANRLAFLAEKAYQFESRRYSSFIYQDYGAQDSLDGRFQSGTRLLTDLDALEHERITGTVDRLQLIKTTFSLFTHMPASLSLLQQTGQTLFRLDTKALDLRFPGLFLHSLKRIEIEFDGLLPAEGVHAVLRLANNSFVRVPNDLAYVPDPSMVLLDWAHPSADYSVGNVAGKITAPFVLKPLLGVGFRQILSEYRRTQDSVIVAPPDGALDVFENLPTDLLFTLELPATGNPFPFADLLDVRITLFFTAKFSDLLAQRQRQALIDEGRTSQAIVLSATAHAADSFAVFRATTLDPKRRDVRYLTFEATEELFPAHRKERVIQNFQLAMLGLKGASMNVRFASGAVTLAPRVATSLASSDTPAGIPSHVPDGMLFTAIGEVDKVIDSVTVYTSRAGVYAGLEARVALVDDANADNFDNVINTYVLKILPDHNDAQCVRDDAGVVVETEATEAALSANASLTYTTGSWRDVEVRALIALVPGTFRLVARYSSAGDHNVFADITLTSGSSLYQFEVKIRHGSAATELASFTSVPFDDTLLDAVYEVTLRVVGLTAKVFIDRVPMTLTQSSVKVTEVALPSSTPAAGSVRMAAFGNASAIHVAHAAATRLRYDGTPLESIIDEPFDALTEWTTAGTVSLATVDHKSLDLSFLQDVLLQLDYTADFDFPA